MLANTIQKILSDKNYQIFKSIVLVTQMNMYSHCRQQGEIMYDEIIFIFEYGYQLEISSDIDYMSLYEILFGYNNKSIGLFHHQMFDMFQQ